MCFEGARSGAPDLLPAVARVQPASGRTGSRSAVAAGAAASGKAAHRRSGVLLPTSLMRSPVGSLKEIAALSPHGIALAAQPLLALKP